MGGGERGGGERSGSEVFHLDECGGDGIDGGGGGGWGRGGKVVMQRVVVWEHGGSADGVGDDDVGVVEIDVV